MKNVSLTNEVLRDQLRQVLAGSVAFRVDRVSPMRSFGTN